MKVRTIKQIEKTDRDVDGENFKSLRLILEKDNMGFSVHKTIIKQGSVNNWHYQNHLEACYCISGKGKITDLEKGFTYDVNPDTIYILDNHDNHIFTALTEVVLISIFNPPVKGTEIHDSQGNYSL